MAEKTFDWKMYRYVPSLIGPIISIVIFSILAGLHLWQLLRTKKKIIVWIVIGTICEVVGYAARIASHFDNESWAPFIIQGIFILIGPLFFAATIYMMLGRTIRLSGGEEVSLIKPKWCTRLFVGADVSTLILQGLGASIMGTMQLELALAGEKIVIAGLALQVATFITFLVFTTDFHIRMNRQTRRGTVAPVSDEWRKILWILYTVSSLVLARCTFRLIEYAMGNAAYLIAHEWTLYVFDTTLMVIVLVLLLVLQPTKYVPQENRKLSQSDSEGLAMESA
ncbi:RTA1 like protein-domain-containing protein [Lophiotrema nucula]|uniref:RTA1 like protein-domain-containing protein n=1 Tax=Lophiotrema nucula TaxID=690887 RepID=A0A6A5YX70_9PLEO|nr:RTA1 like protein-domain-containing protein [Lophiotrema nucula]